MNSSVFQVFVEGPVDSTHVVRIAGSLQQHRPDERLVHPEAQQRLMHQVATPAAASPLDVLTDRERDVLRLIARGKSNKAIASTLFLSVGTVKGYVSTILAKLGVHDRTQAALFAVEHGIGKD